MFEPAVVMNGDSDEGALSGGATGGPEFVSEDAHFPNLGVNHPVDNDLPVRIQTGSSSTRAAVTSTVSVNSVHSALVSEHASPKVSLLIKLLL